MPVLVDTDVLIWHLRGYPQATRRATELMETLSLSHGLQAADRPYRRHRARPSAHLAHRKHQTLRAGQRASYRDVQTLVTATAAVRSSIPLEC